MYTSVLGGQSLTLWADMERTKAEMLALSPGDAAAIEELMKDAAVGAKCAIPAGKPPELMGAMEGIKFGLSMREPLSLIRKYAGTDTGDLAAKFRHPLIRCLITDFCPKESLGQSFPIAYGNFTSGDGGVPFGGSKAAAQRMRARYEELGGRVFAPAVALKFAVEGDLITGLLLKDGTFVKGDFFVAACDLWVTFERLLGWHYAEEKIRKMYENRAAYPVYGMFQAAYAVDSGEDAIDGDVIMDFEAEESWMNGRVSVKTYAYEPGFAPPGKQIVQALLGLTEEAYDVWSKLDKDRPAYEAKKMELAEPSAPKNRGLCPRLQGQHDAARHLDSHDLRAVVLRLQGIQPGLHPHKKER